MELNDNSYTEEVLASATYLHRKTDKDGNTVKYRLYGSHKYIPEEERKEEKRSVFQRSNKDHSMVGAKIPLGSLEVRICCGILLFTTVFPGNCPEILEAIANMKCRTDDILLTTYPKSGLYVRSTAKVIYGREKLRKKEKPGLHWTTNIVQMLVSGTTEYVVTPQFLESDTNFGKYEKMNSPRITSTHVHFDLLPREIIHTSKGKIINISRNPKDVAVSFYAFIKNAPYEASYKGDFNGFLKFYLRGDVVCDGWFEYYKKMVEVSKTIPEKCILFIRYEDMKRDLYGHIHKISEFLGVQHSDEFIRKVEERWSFSSMQKAVDLPWEEFNVVLPIYRKGKIGDWKNWFTVAQNELFDAVYSEKMSGLDVKFDYC